MIRFQLNKTYPNPDYDLCLSPVLADTCKDVSRAFYDFINNADAKFDRSGNVISIQEWIKEPIFVFKCNTEATSYNETLQVSLRFNTQYYGIANGTAVGANTIAANSTTPSKMLVVVMYDETVRLTYCYGISFINLN